MDRRTDESHCLKKSKEFAVRDYNLSFRNGNTSFVFPGLDDRMPSSGRQLLPELVVLPFAGSGSLLVNFACALVLARFRFHCGLTRAAFLSAHNDILASIIVIVAGLVTAYLGVRLKGPAVLAFERAQFVKMAKRIAA